MIARTVGKIIPAIPPSKKGAKGKPTKMWIVNPNYVDSVIPVQAITSPSIAVVARVIPASLAPAVVIPTEPIVVANSIVTAIVPPVEENENIVLPTEIEITAKSVEILSAPVAPPVLVVNNITEPGIPSLEEVIAAALIADSAIIQEETLPVVVPAEPPSVEAIVESVEVIRIEPAATVIIAEKIETTEMNNTKSQQIKDARQLTQVCPSCKSPLFAMNDATGVIVWCAQSQDKCKEAESPFGHARSEAQAINILMERWERATAGSVSA